MELVNCTGRTIHLRRQDGVVIHLDPSPAPIRLLPKRDEGQRIQGIDITLVRFQDVENLPPLRPRSILICEPDVAMALSAMDRWDVVAPGTIVEDGVYPVYGGLVAWDCTEEVKMARPGLAGSIVNLDAEHFLENL